MEDNQSNGQIMPHSGFLKLSGLAPAAIEPEEEEVVIPTMCHGCSYGGYNCGLLAHVRNGIMERVEGNPFHPLNRGRVCAKGNSAVQWVYNSHRLKHPLKRVGEKGSNQFKRVSWDEALDTIAEKIASTQEQYGPEYIVMSKGQASGWFNLYHKVWSRFLHALGSPNFTWWGAFVCYLPPLFYQIMTIGGPTYARADYDHADLIIEWFTSGGMGGPARGGVETKDTNLRSVPTKVIQRLKQGAELVVINPQLIPLGANGRAQKWLPIRPGTDAAMALAMIHVIINEQLYDSEFVEKWCHGFESLKEHIQQYTPEWAEQITDIPALEIASLARKYATAKRACIRFSEAPQKSNLQPLMTSLAILMAITGHIDSPGGNIYFYPAAKLNIDTFDDRISEAMSKRALGADKFWINTMGGPTHTGADFISLIEALVNGRPYRPKFGMFFCTNPMSTARNPDLMEQALKQLEFLVVADIVPTPTARYADIILPSSSRYESPGAPNIWENHLMAGRQVIDPLWESKNDLSIILELSKKLGLEEDFWGGDFDAMCDDYLKSTGLSVDVLRENALSGIFLPRTEWMDSRHRHQEHMAHLPHKKVQLFNEFFQEEGYDPLPIYRGEAEGPEKEPGFSREFPLTFTDEHADYLNHHSWMRNVPWLRELQKQNYVKIHPKTAREFEVHDGDWVEVISPHGRMKAVIRTCVELRPGTVMGQHGWWQGCSDLDLPEHTVGNGGTNTNVLFDWHDRDPITENLTKNTFVRLVRCGAPEPIQSIEEMK